MEVSDLNHSKIMNGQKIQEQRFIDKTHRSYRSLLILVNNSFIETNFRNNFLGFLGKLANVISYNCEA